MNRDEALSALGDVDVTERRSRGLLASASASNTLIIWGLVWAVCNISTQLWPLWGPTAWGPGIVIGSIASFWLSRRTAVRKDFRSVGALAIYVGLDVALIVALKLASPAQQNLVASLLVCAGYMLFGVFVAWRIGAVGLGLAILTLAGWYLLNPWFFAWMGVVGGGALILTGLWLRRL